MEKEGKNMIKLLTYVTKINKHKKENTFFFQKLMKNLKISFNEENNCIKYDEYYFNGIQTPKDIEFKDISMNSFKLFWKIDNVKIININNNKIKYKVEIRKDNKNEKFTKVYEGQDSNCEINNLNEDMNYEVRICSFYNELQSPWSIIQKIQTGFLIVLFWIDVIIKKNILKKYMNGAGIKKWNYYIEEAEMVL